MAHGNPHYFLSPRKPESSKVVNVATKLIEEPFTDLGDHVSAWQALRTCPAVQIPYESPGVPRWVSGVVELELPGSDFFDPEVLEYNHKKAHPTVAVARPAGW